MYLDFFGLSAKPFQLTADPRFLYPSKAHSRAIAYLSYGLSQAEGFIVITGDIGTGKTTLVKNLFSEIDSSRLTAAQLVTTQVDDFDLMKLINAAFRLEYKGLAKGDLLQQFQAFLEAEAAQGKRVLLVIDEAQNLPIRTLEELRMLSNYEVDGKPMLQCFLLGQKEFRITIGSPQLKQLRERVIASTGLQPLSKQDTQLYTNHRLTLCGWKDDPQIEQAAHDSVYQITGGIPRKINLLWDRIFLYACLEEVHRIDESLVAAVEAEMAEERYSETAVEEHTFSVKENEDIHGRLAALESVALSLAKDYKEFSIKVRETILRDQ
ncbi:MAG TPA: ATPase [Gammaproteobacteria bacterium]|nr:ATPase [Gammaproteobacteria bacterium]